MWHVKKLSVYICGTVLSIVWRRKLLADEQRFYRSFVVLLLFGDVLGVDNIMIKSLGRWRWRDGHG